MYRVNRGGEFNVYLRQRAAMINCSESAQMIYMTSVNKVDEIQMRVPCNMTGG